jgi:hypothetical protein
MPNLPDISEGWLALFGALLGGSGLKILEAWLNRSKVKEDSATELRNELRKEVRGLRDELRTHPSQGCSRSSTLRSGTEY